MSELSLNIPLYWKTAKLGEVCDIISLNKIKIKQKEYLPHGKYPVIDQGQELIGGYYNDERLVVPGEPPYIIFGDHTKVKKYVNFKFIAGADGVKVLKPKEIFNSKLFFYFLHSIKIPDKGYARHFQFLKKTIIPLPPLPEQHRIVAKIEELFSELDNAVENLKKAKEQLKVYRHSVLKWAFEGKLTEEWRKERYKTQGKSKKELQDEEVSLAAEEKINYKTKYNLPLGWKCKKIVDLISNEKHALKAGPFGSSLKKEFYVESGYKIYGQEQVIIDDPFFGDYYISDTKYRELASNRIKPFDILISLVGTVGKVLILPGNCKPGIINPRLIKVSLNIDYYLPLFFKYYFESSLVKSYYSTKARGTTMDVLNLGIIKTIPFPVCEIEEQHQIIQEIETRFSVADKLEQSINQSLQQAEALRQSILKRAFEGKLLE